jgi:hypothetical protein
MANFQQLSGMTVKSTMNNRWWWGKGRTSPDQQKVRISIFMKQEISVAKFNTWNVRV